jgi:recombinational DNA repair protein RecT
LDIYSLYPHNGQKHQARIIKAIDDHEKELLKDQTRTKFLCYVNDDKREQEIIVYNDLMNYLETDGQEVVWKFKRITAHQVPLTSKDR